MFRRTLTIAFALAMTSAVASFACGSLTVTNAAAMAGSNFGLELAYDGTTDSCFINDDTPDGETTYTAFFRLKPSGSFSMNQGDGHAIFRAVGGGQTAVEAKLRQFSSGTFVQLQAKRDNGTFAKALVSQAPGQAGWRFEWQASSAPGADDGFLRLLKRNANGTYTCIKEVVGIDNDEQLINNQRIGGMGGIDAATAGSTYFDTYESFRTVTSPAPSCAVTFVD